MWLFNLRCKKFWFFNKNLLGFSPFHFKKWIYQKKKNTNIRLGPLKSHNRPGPFFYFFYDKRKWPQKVKINIVTYGLVAWEYDPCSQPGSGESRSWKQAQPKYLGTSEKNIRWPLKYNLWLSHKTIKVFSFFLLSHEVKEG